MSSEKIAKLVRMANQIGDYFRTLPEAEATAGAADHLRRLLDAEDAQRNRRFRGERRRRPQPRRSARGRRTQERPTPVAATFT